MVLKTKADCYASRHCFRKDLELEKNSEKNCIWIGIDKIQTDFVNFETILCSWAIELTEKSFIKTFLRNNIPCERVHVKLL